MGKSCWVTPCVRNPRGEVVESKLWHDLYKLTGRDHNKTLKLYRIATNDKFINSVIDTADFDENGQVTARSFLTLSGRMSEIDDALKGINDSYSKSKVSYDEAIEQINKFNSQSSFKEDYIPSISEYDDENIVDITITTRGDDSVVALEEKLENYKLTSLIKQRLKELGVAYDFIGDAKYAGRFSTKDAKLANDGLYHLIELSQNGNVNDALVEEAAHLATLSLKDTELIKRLLETINEDTIHDLFTNDEIERADFSTKDGKLELAGILVKKAMQQKRILGYGNFLSRIKNFIYSVFSNGKLSSLISDRKLAKVYAQQIAHGFLFDKNSIEDIESVVKETNVELFSKEPVGITKVLVNSIKSIRKASTNIRNASEILAKNLLENVSTSALLEGKELDKLDSTEVATIIGTAISNLTDVFLDNYEDCKDLKFDGEIVPEQIKMIYSLGEIYTSLNEIYSFISSYINSDGLREDPEIFESLQTNLNEIRKIIKSGEFGDKILSFYRASSAQLIQEILGTDAYKESGKIIFDGFLKNDIVKGRHWSAEHLASNYIMEKPYTRIDRLKSLLRHPNNQLDVGTQLFYQAVRVAKYNQAEKYNKALSELADIERRVKEAKLNIEDFYEKLDDGTPSGYFIGPKNYAKYEDQKLKVEVHLKEEFLKEKRDSGEFDDFMKLTKQQKYAEWIIFRDGSAEWNDFMDRTHVDGKHKILTDEFNNKDYETLTSGPYGETFKNLLQEIRDWKKKIDDTCLVEEFGGEEYRHAENSMVPMFSKNHIIKVKSKNVSRADLYKSEEFKDYCLDVTSDNFGSILTDTELTPFNDVYSLMNDGVNRLSLYGINKLKDMSELSTDLFMSLSLYANMAYRYSTLQEVYAKLMMMDKSLANRTGDVGQKFISDSNSQRQKIINQFITPDQKPKTIWGKIWNGAKTFGSLVAIRVLCLSYMSALKNYFGGARVVFNDSIADNMNLTFNGEIIHVPMKSAFKSLGKSLNPKYLMANWSSIILNKEKNWDKYKNLVKRWDGARNPHVRTVLGGNKIKKAYNHAINIMMSNFSMTDESLIALIYTSYMDSVKVYDADTMQRVSLTDTKNGAYKFDSNNNPILKNGLLKDIRFAPLYRLLVDASNEVKDIIANNNRAKKEAEADGTTPVLIELYEERNVAIHKLLEFLDENDIKNQMPGLYNSHGEIANSSDVLKAIQDKLDDICFTKKDEINICEQINDYITSSQGLYGALNANAIMADANLAMFARLKGWLFGFMQRWFFENPSVLNNDYKSCVLSSEALALSCIVGNNKNIFETDMKKYKEDKDYRNQILKEEATFRLCMLLSVCIPFALKMNMGIFNRGIEDKTSKTIREYLQRKGWAPDQLSKISFLCFGFWIQQAISFLARRLFSRGNFITWGNWAYKAEENRNGKKKKFEKPGLIFKLPQLENSILEDSEAFEKRYEMWSKQGFPKVLNRRKNIESYSTKSELPPINELDGGEVFYIEDEDSYYRAKVKDNRPYTYEKVDYGYYEEDSAEFNEHELAMHYMNYYYDKNSVAYHLAGAMYRLSRAVEDEGDALVNPLRLTYETIEIANPIGISAGVIQLYKLVKTAQNDGIDATAKKEFNFWLKKLGFEFDGDGKPIIGDEYSHSINLLDWYNTQDSIDRFNESKWYR